MDSDNRNRLIAGIITMLIMAGVVALLVSCGLHYEWPPEQPLITELKQDSIMFGGEYVMLGDSPEATPTDMPDTQQPDATQNIEPEPNVAGDDLEDAGEPAKQAPPVVTAKQESPMKVKEKPKEEKPKKTGPATETPKTTDKQTKVKRGNDAATDTRVRDAFGKSSGNGSGKQGSTSGNSTQGAVTGKPGIGGLDGYTLEYWGRPHSKWTGSVTVRVRVNTRGKVVEARATSGKGEAWSHPEVRRSCEQESLKSAFSVPKSTTTEGIGYITWTFI